jgi:hypothetical protein
MINRKTTTKAYKLLHAFVILFLFIFFLVFFKYSNDKPRGIHQWAQADRLSIALRYIEGRPLNDPATLSMKTTDGKVGVEFSGYQYLIAQVVRAGFNPEYLPILYRMLTFVIFFCSLFFLLFKILDQEDVVYGMAIFVGIISSPILLFYSYNFLPDILALSLLLWCFYFIHTNFTKHIIVIILLSGLSLLIKTSSGIYFISFYAIYFLSSWKKWNGKFVFSTILFLLIAGGVTYYDYVLVNLRNQELNSYVFLSGTRPAANMVEFWNIFDTAERFLKEYFTGAQWGVFWIVVGYHLYRIKRISIKSKYTQLLGFLFLGLLSIIILFGVQYKDHDYYVLGTFMPIILFAILKTVRNISAYLHPRAALILAFCFAVISFTQGSNRYFNRMSETVHINGYPEPYKRDWLINADKKIESFVEQEELVLVIYAPEPNHALVYLNRKGATFNTEEMGREKSPFPWFIKYLKAKYVVCATDQYENLKKDEPTFIERSEILFQDAKLMLFETDGY